jgi:hypothetical protein
VAILDAPRTRAALIGALARQHVCDSPQPKKRPQLRGELSRWGLLCPEAPSTMGEPSAVPIHPGEGFWINPFGLENGAGSLVAYFELMVLIRSASAAAGDSAPIRTMKR